MANHKTIRAFLLIRHWWHETRTSFWFMPALIVSGAVALATGLVTLDSHISFGIVDKWPLLFGAGAAGSRGLLTAVASSMITVAGVVFSITIVALSLTSSQYTSRVLRNFMKDTINQIVLGVFVGIFAYCLVVLRTIRGGDEGTFVPSIAVLVSLILAFVGIAFLIFFIHHIALSIQASSIISAAATETNIAIDLLFPEGLGDERDAEFDESDGLMSEDQIWITVSAKQTGYIESVDGEALLAFAKERKSILRMERGIGEFVISGTPLIGVAHGHQLVDNEVDALRSVYVVSRQRTLQQDAGFGIRQIVDIALKALSPGVNDTTTAVMCVDYLAAILVRLASRVFPASYRFEDGKLLLIARGPTFESMLAEAFNQIRQNSEGNVAVLTRLADALTMVAGVTVSRQRRNSLLTQAMLLSVVAKNTIPPHEMASINVAIDRLMKVLV